MEIDENIYTDTDIIGYPIKHYIKQIKIFSEEDSCNRWLRDKEPEQIIDIKMSRGQYSKTIMVIYMEEI